ncbi:unnamed protein product [Heligmosomoides polygyrus]|uniref:Secreted protein n=1 Tax=Heligmosomoides polygyrus TaxID=6339 RepID=A0A183G963_HELPZ|nr:unnamed protein product [Heligmosomoides polygyrus]
MLRVLLGAGVVVVGVLPFRAFTKKRDQRVAVPHNFRRLGKCDSVSNLRTSAKLGIPEAFSHLRESCHSEHHPLDCTLCDADRVFILSAYYRMKPMDTIQHCVYMENDDGELDKDSSWRSDSTTSQPLHQAGLVKPRHRVSPLSRPLQNQATARGCRRTEKLNAEDQLLQY